MEIKASVLFCGDRRESSSSFSSSSSKRMNGEDVQLSRPAAHECRNIPSRDTFPSSSSLCARPFPFFNALVSLVFYVYEKLPNHGDENSRQLGEFVIRPTERKKRNFFFLGLSFFFYFYSESRWSTCQQKRKVVKCLTVFHGVHVRWPTFDCRIIRSHTYILLF